MDRQTELMNRHQDLLECERVFCDLLRRLGAISISTSVHAQSTHRHDAKESLTAPPFGPPPSRQDLLERESALQRMQKQLITTMSTSLRATVAHHHANDNISPSVVPAVNTVYPDQHLSLAFLYEVGPMPLADALDIVLVEFWGNKENLDATIAGVSKAWNRRFWEVRLAKSQAFSIVCDEDEERTAAGLYSLLRRHPVCPPSS